MESNWNIVGVEEIVKFKTRIDAYGIAIFIEFAGGEEYPKELMVGGGFFFQVGMECSKIYLSFHQISQEIYSHLEVSQVV